VAPTPRELWQATEGVHAVAYFSTEVDEAVAATGITGWWRSYFAGRAAPMGMVGPEVVAATFANFAPAMVERNLPSAWAMASPEAVLSARDAGLVAAFARLDDRDGTVTAALGEVAPLLDRAADAAPLVGRPLAAAWAGHRAALLTADAASVPVGLRAWSATTVLREQRGDAHVAALAAAGLDGCEAHLTLAGTGRVPGEVLQGARGWTDDDWGAAHLRLVGRGLLADDGALTPAGASLRTEVEAATDRAAAVPWSVLGDEERRRVVDVLGPLGALIAERLPIRVPNPMGWEPVRGY
jgi:hypothetical protein